MSNTTWNMKYKLTNNKKTVFNLELTQIECIETFNYASKGDLGGWIEKETNLSGNAQVSGNARVSGNAQVSGDARVCAEMNYTKGWFIGGDDSRKITDITSKTGSEEWKNQYVLGDYEITPIYEEAIIEITLEEIAKLKGVDVSKIIIK